jgi:hypothetical protein
MSNLSKTVGQTPLIKISERIFSKFEGQNPSGSIPFLFLKTIT